MEITKENIINDVLMRMAPDLEAVQLRTLETALIQSLYYVDLVKKQTALATQMDDNDYLLDVYQTNVRKDGLSPKTITAYMRAMRHMLDVVDKNIRHITSIDIKFYLDGYASGGNDPRTVNNERRFLSAVFTWYRKHGLISANPVEAVPNRKERRKPIDYLKGVEVDHLQEGCRTLRERAILEFLLSTGVRVGEVPAINREDIDWRNGEVLIYGHKTQEYRTVYLTDVAAEHLRKYLDSRTDKNPSLFVWSKRPYKTLQETGIRSLISNLGKRAAPERRVYPHLMRKTMATTLRAKDCPVEDIQHMLGHSNPSTTLAFYAAASTDRLRYAHNRYLAAGA